MSQLKTITVLAEELEIPVSTLRSWVKHELVPCYRTTKGYRMFSEEQAAAVRRYSDQVRQEAETA